MGFGLGYSLGGGGLVVGDCDLVFGFEMLLWFRCCVGVCVYFGLDFWLVWIRLICFVDCELRV